MEYCQGGLCYSSYPSPMYLVEPNKKVATEKRIIFDFMKDHLIPHIMGKSTQHWFSYIRSSMSLVICSLGTILMIVACVTQIVASQLIRITELTYQLFPIGEKIGRGVCAHINIQVLSTFECFCL